MLLNKAIKSSPFQDLALENEVACLESSYENALTFIARLNEQRALTIRQRNIILRQLRIEAQKNRDIKRWS